MKKPEEMTKIYMDRLQNFATELHNAAVEYFHKRPAKTSEGKDLAMNIYRIVGFIRAIDQDEDEE